MKEAQGRASLAETQSGFFCTVATYANLAIGNNALALLRPILMMQFEAVEEEIEFSQIEKPS